MCHKPVHCTWGRAGADTGTDVVVRHAYLEPVSMGRVRVLLCAMCTLNLRMIVPNNCPIDRLFKGVSICTHATHLSLHLIGAGTGTHVSTAYDGGGVGWGCG